MLEDARRQKLCKRCQAERQTALCVPWLALIKLF
jgi:hypothetical protein